MDSAPLLDISDLCIDFRTRQGLVRAVQNLSFTIAPREILGLVGESGSGKTISMLASVGLINDPNAIISGSIKYKGRELIGLSNRALQKLRGPEIAMIFQDPMTAMTPVHSIGWQITEQVRAHEKLSARAAKSRAIDLLATMGMPSPREQYHRYPHQLSGGLRQRAMIAMALSCNPSLLIADEPTTALDVTVQAQILNLLDNLRRDFNSSIILITHDMGVVSGIADRVMVMYAGRLVERGPDGRRVRHPRPPLHIWPAHLHPADGGRKAPSTAGHSRYAADAGRDAARLRLRATLCLSLRPVRRSAAALSPRRPAAACFLQAEPAA